MKLIIEETKLSESELLFLLDLEKKGIAKRIS